MRSSVLKWIFYSSRECNNQLTTSWADQKFWSSLLLFISRWLLELASVGGKFLSILASYMKIVPGNKEPREGTARFLCRHSAECSHFIFSNTVCVTTLVYYTAYLATLALFPCRGVSRRTDKRAVCNRSFDRASWTTSLKTSLSDGPGCWDPEAQLLLSSSRRSERCGTEENRHQRSFTVRGLIVHEDNQLISWSVIVSR